MIGRVDVMIGKSSSDQLAQIALTLREVISEAESHKAFEPIERLNEAAKHVGKSFCGSWLGYHSLVYYDKFSVAPTGAAFSPEYGLMGYSGTRRVLGNAAGSRGEWSQRTADEVIKQIYEIAGNPSLKEAHRVSKLVAEHFENAKGDLLSIFEVEAKESSLLLDLQKELSSFRMRSQPEIAAGWSPGPPLMSRDSMALTQGMQAPPHIDILAETTLISQSVILCKEAARIAERASSHIKRIANKVQMNDTKKGRIFIGHGRSSAWRDLKDFVQERLKLEYDEFNREPVAGVSNTERLSEMLASAAFAFLVLTGEDETAEGKYQARMNVIHETGLFQGRLGFKKAIVLLEEDCEEFSNIQGLGQIRFPKGNISAKFEELRRVLEREGVANGGTA